MTFLLSSENVLNYLEENRITCFNVPPFHKISTKSGKNFNLLVHFENENDFLVKQERFDQRGNTQGEFWNEWFLHQLFRQFPELEPLRSRVTEAIHFDADRSILVFEYLQDYSDLSDFYDEPRVDRFPSSIAAVLGETLALIHRSTYCNQNYENYLTQLNNGTPMNQAPSILYGLERIGVEVFSRVRSESLEFFRLFQRFESLSAAIAELKLSWNPTCLVHRDLRLSNVLLHGDWETMTSPAIRIIDWEKFGWGDPAFDVGSLIAHYLKIWLNRLVVHKGLEISISLKLAEVSIEQLQPSLFRLVQAYLAGFPEILEARSDFLHRVIQFAGVVLIEGIVIKLDYHDAFNNRDICTLQVAKTLLCQSETAMRSILGVSVASDFNQRLL